MASTTVERQETKTDFAITITRLVDAPREQVFDAWLSPAQLTHWWGPRSGKVDWTMPEVQTDAKVGGTYRFGIQSPRGGEHGDAIHYSGGNYREINAPSRLAFSFIWEGSNDDGTSDTERMIAVNFNSTKKNRTVVVFKIDGFASVDTRDGEIEGWHDCLDRLVEHFANDAAKLATDDEAELRRMTAEWSQALEAKDFDRLLADYANDAHLYDIKPPFEQNGLASIRRMWEQCLPCFPDKFVFEHKHLSFTVGSNVAFVHGLHHFKMSGEHPANNMWFRVTVGYRRENGGWKVVHEHVSVPFDPRDGKVVYMTDADIAASRS